MDSLFNGKLKSLQQKVANAAQKYDAKGKIEKIKNAAANIKNKVMQGATAAENSESESSSGSRMSESGIDDATDTKKGASASGKVPIAKRLGSLMRKKEVAKE